MPFRMLQVESILLDHGVGVYPRTMYIPIQTIFRFHSKDLVLALLRKNQS